MCGDDDDGTQIFLIVVPKFHDGNFIHNNFLINCSEYFMQEPCEPSNRVHGVLRKHLGTHLVSNFVELLLNFFICSWSLLELLCLFLD